MTDKQSRDSRSHLDRAVDELEPQIHQVEQRNDRDVHVFDFTEPGALDKLRAALRADLDTNDPGTPGTCSNHRHRSAEGDEHA